MSKLQLAIDQYVIGNHKMVKELIKEDNTIRSSLINWMNSRGIDTIEPYLNLMSLQQLYTITTIERETGFEFSGFTEEDASDFIIKHSKNP